MMKFFLLIFSFVLLPSYCHLKEDAVKTFSFLAKQESQLEHLIKILICHDQFGYTLFGDKPVSISGYLGDEEFGNWFWHPMSTLKSFFPLWKEWIKQNNIHLSHFLLFEEKDFESENLHIINLVNKKAFLSKVKEHLGLFQEILGNDITPELLLEKVIRNQNLFEALNKDEGLYGILLGYGVYNSLQYKRYWELAKILDPFYAKYYKSRLLCYPRSSSEFSSLKEEYEDLLKRRSSSFNQKLLSSIDLPPFVVFDENAETKVLREKYLKVHRELLQIYSREDFLQIVLSQLCGYYPAR